MRKVVNCSTRSFETRLELLAPYVDAKSIIGKKISGSMNARVVQNAPPYEVEQ